MKKKCIFILFLFFTFLSTCNSAHAVRPLSTEDATVLDVGELEIEMGSEYTRVAGRDNNYNFAVVPCYGLIKNVQVGAEIPFDVLRPKDGDDEEGLGDITLFLKTLFLPETEKIPSILLKTAVKLATGDEDKGLGSGDEDVTLIFAATKSIGSTTVYGNIGYSFVGKDWDDSLNDYLIYGIAFQYSLSAQLSILGEVYGESESDFNNDSHTISPLVGLAYKLNDNIRLDTAFKMGISYEDKTDYGIIGGVSISF